MSTSRISAQGMPPSRASGSTFPVEDWVILLLGALAAGLLGAVVGNSAVDADPAILASLATAGYMLGYVLAGTLLPDLIAHLLAFVLGVVISLVAIDSHLVWQQLRAGDWRGMLDRYETLLSGFWSSLKSGERFETDIAIFAIGLTIWLVGYTASWMLFRRGWLFWSLALPGAILLVTMALDRDQPTWPALVYLGLALVIAATHTALVQRAIWRSHAVTQPSSFGRRSIVLGSLFAVLAVGVGLWSSFDLDDRIKERAFDNGDRLASWVSDRFDPSEPPPSGPQPAVGNYGSFSDQFKVGDGVPTGDSPLVVVQSNDEEYLAARRLNDYDGSGWKATTSSTEGQVTDGSRMAFQADQPMNLPRDQMQYRTQDQATVVILQPTGNLLFTIDQHYSASVPTLVRVGWESIDATYEIGSVDISAVPVDLRELVLIMEGAQFSDPKSTGTPEIVSEQDKADIARIQDGRLQSYPVSTELSWSDSGTVLLHIEGRLPVYSDVEAVFSNEDLTAADYSIVGLAPQVAASDLELASSTYPTYVTDTYLSLPGTVTQETRDLASQIVSDAGATTPYDMAVAIQNYLRSNFTYQIDAEGAPDGRDIVDYFLFESKVGRCDHYASSMAVMLRSLGVPTRIVTGLAPVPYDRDMNGYVYRGRNAHAWVEVYFPGFGWIPFEPTPSQQAIDLNAASAEPVTTPEPSPTPIATEAPAGTQLAASPTPTPTPLPAPATVDTEAGSGNDRGVSWSMLGGLAGAVALFGAGTLLYARRRRMFAGLPVASANYGRLQRLGRFFGLRASPEQTPREFAMQFAKARPESAAGALKVADAYTQAQYATNVDAGTIAQDSDYGWREAKAGASDWRFWRR